MDGGGGAPLSESRFCFRIALTKALRSPELKQRECGAPLTESRLDFAFSFLPPPDEADKETGSSALGVQEATLGVQEAALTSLTPSHSLASSLA